MATKKLFFNIYSGFFNMTIILAVLVGSMAFPTDTHALGFAIEVNTIADNTTKDGLCSLREAITNANRNWQYYTDCTTGASDDGIFFSNSLGTATITLSSPLPAIKDFVGLSINGGGDITIDGAYNRVFLVNNRVPLALDGLIVTRGGDLTSGGGLYSNGGFVTITNSTFRENRAGNGGGAYNNGGNLTITNSTFFRNSAGINVPGNNDGGGVYHNGGVLTITNSTFSGNGAYSEGGGIYIASGTTTITNSTFSGNGDVFIYGAGIYAASGTLTISKSTFSLNTANQGAGVYISSGTSAITNSTFSGNTNNGVVNLGTTTITNSTFSGNNDARHAGGGVSNFGTLYLFNSILANTTTGPDCYNNNDLVNTVTGNNNLIETDSLSPNACGTGALALDPRLEALTGSPAYFVLNSSSPAINAGDDAICAAVPVNNTSQNGVTRPQGAHCEIGSFEMPSALVQSPQEAIVGLSSEIQGLVDNGAITTDNGKNLSSILDSSIQALDQGDIPSGIKMLESFIDQVNALIKSEELKSTDGQLLIDDAQTIIESLY